MTPAATLSERPWLPLLLGGYAALVAVLPFPGSLMAGALPAGVALFWFLSSTPHRWLRLLLPALIILPPLPIALGDSGPHPAIALAGLGLLMGLWQASKWRQASGGPALALGWLWAVMLFSLCAAAFYSGTSVALASLARALLFGIPVYVFWYLTQGPGVACIDESTRWTRHLFLIAVLAAAFACLDFYLQFTPPAGFAPQYVWLDTGVYRRAQGLFYEASTLGNFCAFFLVMTAVALVRGRNESPVPFGLLLPGAGVLTAALLFSYSRASILNVLVAIAALILVRRGAAALLRPALWMTLSAAIVTAAAYYTAPAFVELYWRRLSGSVLFFLASPEGVLSGRVASWQSLFDFAAANPHHALLGIGYKTLPYTSFLGQPIVADNAYLSAWIEMGIPGLAAVLALNIAILRAGWRAAHSASPRASFFGAWIFCFWAGQCVQMLSGDLLTYWRVLPLYFWVLAMAMVGTAARK